MTSTTWAEYRYKEFDSDTIVHKTIALHGEALNGGPVETRLAYVRSDVFSRVFLICCGVRVDEVIREYMVKRMHSIIMEISGSLE